MISGASHQYRLTSHITRSSLEYTQVGVAADMLQSFGQLGLFGVLLQWFLMYGQFVNSDLRSLHNLLKNPQTALRCLEVKLRNLSERLPTQPYCPPLQSGPITAGVFQCILGQEVRVHPTQMRRSQ